MDPQANKDRAVTASIRNFFSNTNLEMVVTQIDKSLLQRAKGYQRPTSRKVVLKIAKNYDPLLFRPLTVSMQKDGALVVVDGEHRRQAAVERTDILTVPCIVHSGLSYREEAKLFYLLNSSSKKMSRFAAFNALMESEDTRALFIAEQIRNAGLRLLPSASSPGEVGAIEKIEMLQRGLTQPEFLSTLRLAAKLCVDRPVSRDLLAGIVALKTDAKLRITDPGVQSRILSIGIGPIMTQITLAKMEFGKQSNNVCGLGIRRALDA